MPIVGKAQQSKTLIIIIRLLGEAAAFQLATSIFVSLVPVQSHIGAKGERQPTFRLCDLMR